MPTKTGMPDTPIKAHPSPGRPPWQCLPPGRPTHPLGVHAGRDPDLEGPPTPLAVMPTWEVYHPPWP